MKCSYCETKGANANRVVEVRKMRPGQVESMDHMTFVMCGQCSDDMMEDIEKLITDQYLMAKGGDKDA